MLHLYAITYILDVMARIFGFKTKEEPKGLDLADDYSDNGGLEEICGLSNLYSPEQDSAVHIRDIADVLLDMGKINQGHLSEIRRLQEQTNRDVLKIITEKGFAKEPDVSIARANLYNLEFREIEPDKIDKEAFGKLDPEYIKNNRIIPIGFKEEKLVVATSHPGDLFVIEDVKRQTNMDVETVVCIDEAIDQICKTLCEDKADYNLDDIISDMTDVEIMQDVDDISEDLEKMAGQSPIIKFVNYLISNAVREGVSDIHIEPKEKSMKTRYRIDGVLFETMQSPLKMHPAIVSRIKIMANLDISERRLPQDGKIKVSVGGRAIDLRVSTLPTNHGEKVVIRVLDSKSILRGLEQLGMEKDIEEIFHEQVQMPHGIMLVTGPTGSGKSTTLYSALAQMDGNKLNISTVEDPVEYELEFCNQVQANEKIGLDFAAALRSLLRQDPDVIMIGEIRDNETARIAVQAALTGHLVLSTLHTNDAPSSITRLVDIGIDSYLIAASLNAVLAQRLVRKICPKCKEIYQVSEHIKKYVEKAGITQDQLFHGVGCDQCRGSGYVGRAGIYELLIVNELFRDMINKDSSINNMRHAFYESGSRSMYEDGLIKVKQGFTTIEEVLRVTQVYGTTENEDFAENYSSK
ncbi:MAG: type II/IV secretion system protein [Sedimentisphaerales bacterium]|nr:type II/IV secretion system protein [Sedimentisphaerales bacterium]